jgi:hypothetical protein
MGTNKSFNAALSRRALMLSPLAFAASGAAHAGAAQGQLSPPEIDPLDWVPAAPLRAADAATTIVTYGDIAGYFTATGREKPDSFNSTTSDQWIEVSQRIPIDDGVMFPQADLNWDWLVGFVPAALDQVMVAFAAPDSLRYYTGSISPGRVWGSLTSKGYSERSVGAFTVYDRVSDDLDLGDDLSRFTLGAFNHVATTFDLVIAARTADTLDLALELISNEGESLLDMSELEGVTSIAGTMTGYIMTTGATLLVDPMVAITAGDRQPLPLALAFLAGIAIEDGEPIVSFIADYADPKIAASAAPIIQARLDNGRSAVTREPYVELMPEFEVDVVPGTAMVRVRVAGDEFAARWMRMIFARDLDFVASG